LLATDCNDVKVLPAQQCQYFGYNADGQESAFASSDGSSPGRTYVYDPDGRATSITASVSSGSTHWNEVQAYTYDANGRLATSTDPTGPAASGITDGNATITHNYYPDGTESSLDVASTALNQIGLFQYAYRPDGALETKVINDASVAGVANPGATNLTYVYKPSGRMTTRTESGVAASPAGITARKTWDPTYGFETTDTTTQLPLAGFEYGPEGDMLGFSTTGAAGSGGTALAAAGDWTYSYTTRGELSSWPTIPVVGQSPQASAVFANGVTNQSPAGPSTTYQSASWDSRMGVMTGNTTQVRAPIAGPTLSYGAQYDAAGRLISAALSSSATPGPSPRPGQTPTPAPAPTAEAGTYDAENHALDGGLITWGPNGHPIVITNGTSQTLHWNGNQILFSTRTIGGTVQVDDIKIGMEGDNHAGRRRDTRAG